VFATGDASAVCAAVLCFKQLFNPAFPGGKCVAFGVGVSELPRLACVEVSLHTLSPAALSLSEAVGGIHICRASGDGSQLIVAFILHGDSEVSELSTALSLLRNAGPVCDVACTAWITGRSLQHMAAILDADAEHNWSVLSAHSLCCECSTGQLSGCSAILSIAKHRANPQSAASQLLK
jgi:hypothetical protein